MKTILLLLIGYLFLMFFVTRLVVPNLTFWKSKLPEKISSNIMKEIKKLKKFSKNERDFLEKAFESVGKRYSHSFAGSIIRCDKAFKTDLEIVWNEKGQYQTCNVRNYLLRVMLVKSGYFKDGEIKPKAAFMNFSLHQYLLVKVDGKWTRADPWAYNLGIKLGQKTPLFMM